MTKDVMVNTVSSSPLGKASEYSSQYTQELLCSIPRVPARKSLGFTSTNDLPFKGVDLWTGFEVSWLNENGLPQVAWAEFTFPCDSPAIVESKSFKLYLNSFNQTKFSQKDEVCAVIKNDLSQAAGMPVNAVLFFLEDVVFAPMGHDFTVKPFLAELIDKQNIIIEKYSPSPETLSVSNELQVRERLCSDLLKTNCPVTSQPDWASLYIEYEGGKICREGLLRYIISFRQHEDFHEHCIERIFCDILTRCMPEKLTVYARYTRRGGLDINPFRSTHDQLPPAGRLWRQ